MASYRRSLSSSGPKIFVLDTSVILYDASSINNFEEHDVAVPLTVLEELDQFKKGNNVLNLQAREFVRQLDRRSEDQDLRHWVPLDGKGRGRLRVIAEEGQADEAGHAFGNRKNDHRILNAALTLARQESPRRVILVSKDIALRVKARALGLEAEDYETIRVADAGQLYKGKSELEVADDSLIDQLYDTGSVPVEKAGPSRPAEANHYFILRGLTRSGLGCVNGRTGNLERVVKTSAYGIQPRNAEQTFAIHAILNPEVPLVSLSGPAGTGKTLIALAAALEQRRRYRQIYLARPIVPLSNKDIGYLPGDIQSKIGPYMQPLWDSLGVIKDQFDEGHKEGKRVDEMVALGKLHVVPLAYIRGRSFSNIIFVVDEAQNLTPHEVKTIITRAGEGTKIVFTGDIFQIDTPYLDAESNGLSYLIDRMRGNPLYAHVNLDKGERSELANLASQLL
ncbi:MAG: PhoH family protein [Thermoanaerobaculia bacterium]